MRYKARKSLFFRLVAASLLCLISSGAAHAAPATAIGPLQFSPPDGFEPVKMDDPRVLLMLRRTGSGYPSFNVIVRERGLGDNLSNKSQQIRAILEGYHSVGFSDAVESGETANIAGNKDLVAFDIAYSSAGKNYLSTVLEFEYQGKIFTATFLTEAEHQDPALKEAVLRGFAGTIPSRGETTDRWPSFPLALLILFGGLGAAILARLFLGSKKAAKRI